jgi:hypothetical protein
MRGDSMPAECRLCSWTGNGWPDLEAHLKSHEIVDPLGDDLAIRLHAAKDYPDRSENTLGLYDRADRLMAVIVRIRPRSLDDPMRFEGE